MAFEFDPNASNPDNYFQGEPQTTNGTLLVTPDNAPFFTKDLVVIGFNSAHPGGKELKLHQDYVYSPLFTEMTFKVRAEVFSYLILMREWDSVEIDYRAVGSDPDTALLQEVVDAGSFDRSVLANWLQFRGQEYRSKLPPALLGDSPKSLLEILSDKMQQIADLIDSPPVLDPAVTQQITTKMQELQTLEADVQNLVAAVNVLNYDQQIAQLNSNLNGLSTSLTNFQQGISANINGHVKQFFGGAILQWDEFLKGPVPTDKFNICNGTNGTPDLKDKFIIGAGKFLAPGTPAAGWSDNANYSGTGLRSAETGGSVSKTTASGGDFTVVVAVEDHILTVDQLPAHSHELPMATSVGGTLSVNGGTGEYTNVDEYTAETGNNEGHNHGASVSYQDSSSNPVGSLGHTHSISDIRPPYYTLVFIQVKDT